MAQSLVPTQAPVLMQLKEPVNLKMIQQLLAKGVDQKDFLAAATSAVVKTPDLLNCTPASFFMSLLNLAQLGLFPATPLNQAHLVKFGTVCVPIIDYRGLIHLGIRGGTVRQVQAEIVCEKDEFDCHKELTDNGLKTVLRHRWPSFGERGEMIGVYCVITFPDHSLEVKVTTMSKAEVLKIGKRSKAFNSGPWQTDFNAMAIKTCIKQAFKIIPLSSSLAKAIEVDNAVDITGEPLEIKVDMETGEAITLTEKQTSKGSRGTREKLRERAEAVAVEPPTKPMPPEEPVEPEDSDIEVEPPVTATDDGFESGLETDVEDTSFNPITKSQMLYLNDLFTHHGMKESERVKWLSEKYAISSVSNIPASMFTEVKSAIIKMFAVSK